MFTPALNGVNGNLGKAVIRSVEEGPVKFRSGGLRADEVAILQAYDFSLE